MKKYSNTAGLAALCALTLLAVLLSGCGSNGMSSVVLAGNVRNATALPTETPTPTDVLVVAWALFGTPTPGAPGHLPVGEPHLPGQEPPKPGAGPTLPPTATFPPPPTATPTPVAVAENPSGGSGMVAVVGNAQAGARVFSGVGTCNSCHEYQRGVSQTGPSLKGVGTRAETRIEGVSAAEYIRQSIINPNAYVVKGFSANVMPATFARLLTPTQIDDLVAFLLTLKE